MCMPDLAFLYMAAIVCILLITSFQLATSMAFVFVVFFFLARFVSKLDFPPSSGGLISLAIIVLY